MKSKVYIQLKDLPESPKGAEWNQSTYFELYSADSSSSYYRYPENYLLDHPDFWELKEKKRWKPEEGEEYWFIEMGEVYSTIWDDYPSDNLHFNTFNCFKTENKAGEVAEKTRDLWKKESEDDEI